ncbi:DUF2934 domain-containing protein [Siccirubricoccus deserti]|uniref:DUF2934 domain-containing protein n=1 Tax=Siccirubricoccus deserti TaxID=2013562 RepID=UPI001E5B6C03|nr:DUF2934 domain-containing protein [Siccirubricoccus deserti]
MQDQERIRRRAHEIWEREGRPEGRHEEHWAQACREIEGGGGPSLEPSAPDDAPTPTAPGGGATPAQSAAAANVLGPLARPRPARRGGRPVQLAPAGRRAVSTAQAVRIRGRRQSATGLGSGFGASPRGCVMGRSGRRSCLGRPLPPQPQGRGCAGS